MRIKNLAGIFTGEGFQKKDGRGVKESDTGFRSGPIDILINDKSGLIESIESRRSSDEAFDGTGLIATAGLIDSHTHALFAGSRSDEYFMRWQGMSYQEISKNGGGIHNTVRDTTEASDDELLSLCRERLISMLMHGSTSVEVKSGYGASAQTELRYLRLLKKLKSEAKLPHLQVTFLGLHALPVGKSEAAFVDEMISILPQIAAEKLADFVDAFPEKGFFSLAETLRFAKAAKKVGLRLKLHADELSNLESSATAAAEQALSVDHLQFISAAGISALAQNKTVATLLPATSFYLGLPYANAQALIDAGARVALASDFNPGTAPNHDLAFTMLLAATQFKMSAAEILCALTYNAAAALGQESSVGILAPAMRADLVLWSMASPRSPLSQIAMGDAQITAVFRSGSSISD